MDQSFFLIQSNIRIADNIYKLTAAGDTSAITAPGQFVNIRIDGCFLRRPISVCDCTAASLTLVYKVVGEGTQRLSQMEQGQRLDLLTGLGNGYDLSASGDRPLLVGGGVGVPPLYLLCKKLMEAGKKPVVVLGFQSEKDVFYEKEFVSAGADVYISTADGTKGSKGFVTDIIPSLDYTFFYACGPEPMFRAMAPMMKTKGQFSFEERMGCGFGACMGCSCKTLTGNKRICREGPVMNSEEIIWDD